MGKMIRMFFGLALGVFILSLTVGCNRMLSVTGPITAPGNNPIVSNSALYTPAQACNMVGANLYNFYENQTTSPSGNIFFSPFSIITCLAMTQEGAVGNTQVQMQNVLGLNPNTATRLAGFQKLITEINSPSKPYTLATADNLWPRQNYPILPAFINTLQTYYDAGVTALDYNNPTGAAQTIDGAVSQETDGYIPNLLTPNDLPPTTALVLTNAIFFQANWQSQFTTQGTRPQNFTLPTGTTESVTMMHENLNATIGNYNGAASVIALPYTKGGASMYIFLPPAGGMSNLENLMTASNINSWMAANSASMTSGVAGTVPVALSLPKFTFSTSYKLKSTLSTLGMPLAFDNPGVNGANFSGIDGGLDLKISEVIHQAYIDVTETGTTAAAATAVIVVYGNAISIPVTYTPFTVDHPFIFMIVDNASNTVLFMGRVNDPLSAN